MAKNLKEISKGVFTLTDNSNPTFDEINTSCLMRIADAAEIAAQNYGNIIAERNRYEKWYREEKAEKEKGVRTISALRGVITRLKNKEKV